MNQTHSFIDPTAGKASASTKEIPSPESEVSLNNTAAPK